MTRANADHFEPDARRSTKDMNRRRLIWMLALLATASVVAALRFGNPGAYRLVYIFQAYVLPRYPDGCIPPPANFTGTWTEWHPTGRRKAEGPVLNGKRHGEWRFFTKDGRVHHGEYYENGQHMNDRIYVRWIAEPSVAGDALQRA